MSSPTESKENSEPLPEVLDKPKVTKADAIRKIKEAQAELERIERTSGPSGAIPRASKAMLLDATEAVAKNPESRVRWVSLANAEKAQVRMLSGYKRLSTEEGGRQVGNLVLCAIPREVYEQRVAELKRIHAERLKAHRTDMEELAENLSKTLRDRHGINISAKHLLINEGAEG